MFDVPARTDENTETSLDLEAVATVFVRHLLYAEADLLRHAAAKLETASVLWYGAVATLAVVLLHLQRHLEYEHP